MKEAVIKNAAVSKQMQQEAVDCANQTIERFNIDKDIAAYIKKEYDKNISDVVIISN